MGVCLLFVSAADRDWAQGLANTLVLELAPNQTHNWFFSHKANSQTGRLTITLLILWGQESEGGFFSSTTPVSHHVLHLQPPTTFPITAPGELPFRAGKGRRADVWHLLNFIALVVKNSLSQLRSELFHLHLYTDDVFRVRVRVSYFVPRYFTQQTNSLYGNKTGKKKRAIIDFWLVLMWVDRSDTPSVTERMSLDSLRKPE